MAEQHHHQPTSQTWQIITRNLVRIYIAKNVCAVSAKFVNFRPFTLILKPIITCPSGIDNNCVVMSTRRANGTDETRPVNLFRKDCTQSAFPICFRHLGTLTAQSFFISIRRS